MVTLLWLVEPIVVAMVGAAAVWLVDSQVSADSLPDMRILALLLLVPILGVALLRRR
jgi:hypothetical protein